MNVLDLFSGIGGFSLGLMMANKKLRSEVFKTIAFCEIDPYCREVLKKNFPKIQIYEDVKGLSEDVLGAMREKIDVITGGFPCQDLSIAGSQKGLQGERSGLFYEIIRLTEELRPKFVLLENSPQLIWRSEYRDELIKEFQKRGYGLWWQVLSAGSFGYLHKRKRAFVFAWSEKIFTDAVAFGRLYHQTFLNLYSVQKRKETASNLELCRLYEQGGERLSEEDLPDIRKLDGLPDSLERIGALGNAVIPEIVSVLGEAICKTLEIEN